jgi:hypothetical protein
VSWFDTESLSCDHLCSTLYGSSHKTHAASCALLCSRPMPVAHELRAFRIRTLRRAYSGQREDLPILEELIDILRDVIAHTRLPGELELSSDSLAQFHHHLGVAFYERFLHRRDIYDLEWAEAHLQLALPVLEAQELLPDVRSVLGTVQQERAYIAHEGDTAQQAIHLGRHSISTDEAVSRVDPVYYLQERHQQSLGISAARERRNDRIRTLRETYSSQQDDLPFLEERICLLHDAIAHARQAPDEAEPSSISLAQHHEELGTTLYERFRHLRVTKDLEDAAMYLQLALSDASGCTSFPGTSSVLGSVIRERACLTKDSDMAEQALLMHRQSCLLSGAMPAFERAHHLRELGFTLRAYALLTQKGDDHVLSESLDCLKEAEALYASVGLTDHLCALGLCLSLSLVFQAKMRQSDLDESISTGLRSLQLCGPSHRDFFRVAYTLSTMQFAQIQFFDGAGSMVPLNQLISTTRAALARSPHGWSILLLDHLAMALEHRFKQEGQQNDLDEAITRLSAATVGLEGDKSAWGSFQLRLSSMRRIRFEVTGIPEDIEAAASAAHLALTSDTTAMTRGYFYLLGQLAACRATQHKAFGDPTCLDDCIDLYDQIVQSAPNGSHAWGTATDNLLETLHQRHQVTGSIDDLERAIKLIPASLEMNVKQSDNYSCMRLYNAANVFLSRFEATDAFEDLDRATTYFRDSVEGYPTSDTYRSCSRVIAYAKVLRIRYEVMREEESITKALELQKQVIDSLPDTHPDRALALCGWARLLLCKPTQHNITEALSGLLNALNNPYVPAYRKVDAVSEVLPYLTSHIQSDPKTAGGNAHQLSVVYSASIALLPQVASFGLEPNSRLSVIAGASWLVKQGATHAISMGQLSSALEMLEAGRNVFWTQNLQIRTSFMSLPEDIGDILTRISYALARPFPAELQGARKDGELARRRQLGEEFRVTLDKARAIPGFEGLLMNASFSSFAQAATHGPIVVLVADISSSHAIIVQREQQCHSITLPNANAKVLERLSRDVDKRSKHAYSSRGVRRVEIIDDRPAFVYEELWNVIMQPIIEALRWPVSLERRTRVSPLMSLQRAAGRERRRLIVCPTGVFMKLPLHAAGIYSGTDQVSCSDYLVVSYTPSIAALLHAQQSAKPVHRSEAKTLLVAVDQPLHGTPLPMTSQEAATVQRLVSPSAQVVRVSTCSQMLENIEPASILHLACHGTHNLSDPLKSSFHLQDGMLPVSKLMELELPSAFLAVLSACETARGDSTQPDQAIHLAATMLFAGFKSVIATMWSVDVPGCRGRWALTIVRQVHG